MFKLALILLASGQAVPVADYRVPLTPPSTWISQADYPKDLHGIQGRTVAVLSINAEGKITACNIRASSGSDILDKKACQRARERGLFQPLQKTQNTAVSRPYFFPVLWGSPHIEVQPFKERMVADFKYGKPVSCTLYVLSGSTVNKIPSDCQLPTESLVRYFGRDYIRASQLTIESMTIAGTGPVIRDPVEGKRVTLKEAVIIIGPDGRPQTCESRIPATVPKESLEQCMGFQTDRKFTGLTAFVRVEDWTLRYPPADVGNATNK